MIVHSRTVTGLVAVLAAAIIGQNAVAAPPSPGAEELAGKAEACIRARAGEVSHYARSMSDAVSFLVEDLCARQVDVFGRYRQSESWLASLKSGQATGDRQGDEDGVADAAFAARQKAALEATRIDPDTGELVPPPGGNGAVVVEVLSGIGARQDGRFRAVAAEAVLAARQAKASKP
jgi:hypothetical protein